MSLVCHDVSKTVHVYTLGGENAETSFGSNIITICLGEWGLIVDSGMLPHVARKVVQDVRSQGVKTLTLVNTHHHGDHTICDEIFAREGARIIAHKKCRAAIAQLGDKRIQDYAKRVEPLADSYKDLRQALPDMAIDSEITLFLGEAEVIISHPGVTAHTAGDAYVYYPSEKTLVTGDILFSQYHPNLVDAEIDGWIKSARQLGRLDADVVVPGHGPLASSGELETQASYLEELKSSVGTALQGKRSLDEITDDFLSEQPPNWKFRQIVRSNVKKVYGELSKGLLMSAK